ncbi:hypothetical protein AMAG_02209 [Allomyces macrogynus ATCC 38327]|uniref:WDR59/RTC1-like RING zinc finger domain-containing protein n=1 Tax=Allomyces macrogynus (strain ATCC 38327) TaxID=578462 RepID=A0A0L0S1W3_ALLM3|nr:hypothetical protein AMAG_02209 [Allomyces macrogynus ATCC 38327]|eukprot:KNE56400.1 hypothetical protein AMAG_02209 [Allomyces macrogynus ATCC 38327]
MAHLASSTADIRSAFGAAAAAAAGAPPLPPNFAALNPAAVLGLASPFVMSQYGAMATAGRGVVGADLALQSAAMPVTPPEELQLIARPGGMLNALSLSPDKDFVVVGGRDVLKILSISANAISEHLNLRAGVRINLNYSSNDVKWCNQYAKSIVATAATNGAIVIWDLNKPGQKMERVINEHTRAVNRIVFHPTDPIKLLSASQDGSMKLWDLRARAAAVLSFESKAESVRDVQFSPTGPTEFSAAFESGQIQKWDLRNPKNYERRISGHNGMILGIDYHPNGRLFATGGRDKMIKIWDLKADARKPKYSIQTIASVGRIAWRPSFDRSTMEIASSSMLTDFRVQVFSLARTHVPKFWFENHTNVVTGMEWVDADTLWTCGKDKLVIRQHAATTAPGGPFHVADVLNSSVVCWSPDGRLVASMDHRPTATGGKEHGGKMPVGGTAKFLLKPGKKMDRAGPFAMPDVTTYKPSQLTVQLDTATFDEPIFAHLASHYIVRDPETEQAVPDESVPLSREAIIKRFEACCAHNAIVAANIGLTNVAQTWSLVSMLFSPLLVPPVAPTDTAALAPPPTPVPLTPARSAMGPFSPTLAHPDVAVLSSSVPFSTVSSNPSTVDPYGTTPASLATSFATSALNATAPGSLAARSTRRPSFAPLPPHPTPSQARSFVSQPMSAIIGSAVTDDAVAPVTGFVQAPVHAAAAAAAAGTAEEAVGAIFGRAALVEMLQGLLDEHTDQGDVQFCCTLVVLLLMGAGDKRAVVPRDQWPACFTDAQVEDWFSSYIELLHRFRLYDVAAVVLEQCPITELRTKLQESTTIYTLCNHCYKPNTNTNGKFWSCSRCMRLVNACSFCHQRVTGQYSWCQGCGHGGHLACLAEWFRENRECCTGCGHRCR